MSPSALKLDALESLSRRIRDYRQLNLSMRLWKPWRLLKSAFIGASRRQNTRRRRRPKRQRRLLQTKHEIQKRSNQATELTARDRKSTRPNSSHRTISYAVICWKKKYYKNTRHF